MPTSYTSGKASAILTLTSSGGLRTEFSSPPIYLAGFATRGRTSSIRPFKLDSVNH